MKPVVWLFILIVCLIPFFCWTISGPYQGTLSNIFHHAAETADSLSHLSTVDGKHAAIMLLALWGISISVVQIGSALKNAD
ncbi:MAG: hypothetical protein ACOYUK_01665 [Patescibacteria group bacterium]